MPGPSDQLQEMAARLKAFGVMMRLGHDLFNAPDFQTAAVMAVNNARPVVGFRSSTLLQIRGRKVDILSQYAQPVVNKHSRQAVLQRELLEITGQLEENLEITAADAEKYGNGKAVRELCPDNVTLLLVPLKAPPFLKKPAIQLVWLLEFEGKIPAGIQLCRSVVLPADRCLPDPCFQPETVDQFQIHFLASGTGGTYLCNVPADPGKSQC